MADQKISAMTLATDLIGSEIPIIQSTTNKRAPIELFNVPFKLRFNITGGTTLRSIGSAPVTILAAPGANKVYNISSVLVSYKYGTVAYNFNVSDTIQLRQGSTVYAMAATVLNSGSSFNYQMYKITTGGTSTTNTDLTFGCSIDATTGDGDLDIIVYYTIEDINT